MPRRATAAIAAIVTLILAACGGGSESADTTGPPVTTQATPVTTEPQVTEPATTEATPSTTTAQTTEPAPTTTEPSIEDQITEASFRVYDLYWSCLRTPNNCDVGAGYLPESDAFMALTNTLEDLDAGGLYVGEDDVGYQVIDSIEIKDDHTAVTTCWWATGVLYLMPPSEGAEITVQNDSRESGLQVDEFVQDPQDGVWKIRRSDQLTTTEGENTCPAEQ